MTTETAKEIRTVDKVKLRVLSGLAALLRLPFARGRITVSEAAYSLLKPASSLATMRVCGYPVKVDLSQRELRYIYFGAFEQAECRFLRRYLREGDVVVDVGANVGYLSALILCRIGKQGKLYAFEPNPEVYKFLLPIQDASNKVMEAFQLAVSFRTSRHQDERVPLFVNAEHSMWSSTVKDHSGTDDPDTVWADTISLADFFESNDVGQVSFIKIDVEGAECDALRGLLPAISTIGRPAILCELAPSDDQRWVDTLDAIAGLMTLGYRSFRLDESGELINFAFENIRDLNYTANVVFAVREWVDARS